jgi:hypothetical protein
VKVFLHSESAARTSNYPVNACPAGDADFVDLVSAPRSFFQADGETPKPFKIEFEYGAAIVPDDLGKYLIARGIAHKTKMPTTGRFKHFLNAAGRVISEIFDADGNRITDYNPGAR